MHPRLPRHLEGSKRPCAYSFGARPRGMSIGGDPKGGRKGGRGGSGFMAPWCSARSLRYFRVFRSGRPNDARRAKGPNKNPPKNHGNFSWPLDPATSLLYPAQIRAKTRRRTISIFSIGGVGSLFRQSLSCPLRLTIEGRLKMSLELSSLLAQASTRKPRRPVAEQMLSIRVCDVRPLVEVSQQTIHLPQMGDSLSLLWRWRSGGCLGPEAAAAMKARQRQAREGRPATEPSWTVEPPEAGIWIFVCPLCSRTCRRLFAPRWSTPARPSSRPGGAAPVTG